MLHRLSLLLLLLCSAIVAPANLRVYDMEAWGLRKDLVGQADGYVKIYCDNRHIGTTKVKRNTANPVWTESFSYGNAHEGSKLKLKVKDKDIVFNDNLGTCETTIKTGTYRNTCNLPTGGKLEYRCSLQ